MAGEDELFQMELNLHPNVEDCVAAIGHRRGYPDEESWEIERLHDEWRRWQDGGRRGEFDVSAFRDYIEAASSRISSAWVSGETSG